MTSGTRTLVPHIMEAQSFLKKEMTYCSVRTACLCFGSPPEREVNLSNNFASSAVDVYGFVAPNTSKLEQAIFTSIFYLVRGVSNSHRSKLAHGDLPLSRSRVVVAMDS